MEICFSNEISEGIFEFLAIDGMFIFAIVGISIFGEFLSSWSTESFILVIDGICIVAIDGILIFVIDESSDQIKQSTNQAIDESSDRYHSLHNS